MSGIANLKTQRNPAENVAFFDQIRNVFESKMPRFRNENTAFLRQIVLRKKHNQEKIRVKHLIFSNITSLSKFRLFSELQQKKLKRDP